MSIAHLRQELASHCMQCLFRPSCEPVNGDVVDQPGEVPAACLEGVPHWGHGQDYVHVADRFLDKVAPHTLLGGQQSQLGGFFTNLAKP